VKKVEEEAVVEMVRPEMIERIAGRV